jgi:hypothetical protein
MRMSPQLVVRVSHHVYVPNPQHRHNGFSVTTCSHRLDTSPRSRVRVHIQGGAGIDNVNVRGRRAVGDYASDQCFVLGASATHDKEGKNDFTAWEPTIWSKGKSALNVAVHSLPKPKP